MSLDAGVRRLLSDFLDDFATRLGWDEEAAARLRSAGEEALMSLVEADAENVDSGLRRLRVAARGRRGEATIDFLAAPQGASLEEALALIEGNTPPADAREISLRLLAHYASSVRHRRYRSYDLLTVAVERSPKS